MTGAVRLATLHPSPTVSGPTVIVKFPCGREVDDPAKSTCGEGAILVWLCTTPDCSGPSDPVRDHRNPDGRLVQSTFDSEPFEFCGLTAGTYYVLPIVDHDDSGTLTNFDWTMGRKNLRAPATLWPAQPFGHEVEVTADVALGTSLVTTSPDASPVVVNFFHYEHPTPARQSEDAWLFAVASLDPDVSATGVGVRAIDLRDGVERDFIPGTPNIDARSLERPEGGLYVGDLQRLAFHDGVAYLAALAPESKGVIFTVRLGADGSVVQGNTIDLVDAGITLGSSDVMQYGAVMNHSSGRTYLAVTNRQSGSLPHRPANPLILVDITDLEADGTIAARAVNSGLIDDLLHVRLDGIEARRDLWFAAETGGNSGAQNLNRVWVIRATTTGDVEHEVYAGELYNPDGPVPECGSGAPYLTAGLWVGEFNEATHAILGGLRHLYVFRFDDDDKVDSGERVRSGSGWAATDLRLDDHAVGFSLMRTNPDGDRLFVFGDCKSRYLAVREADWAGSAGDRTQSRRRIAVLDLTTADADGMPVVDLSFGDSDTAPDVVRESLTGPDLVLDTDIVRGISMDCRGVLWDIYDAFGYLNVAGSTFGADCSANRAADAVVTDEHIYIIGRGTVAPGATGATGLGVASEVWVLDLATGREVLSPGWHWVYDGSSYQIRYGYFGLTLGERANRDVSKALFFVK